MVYCGVVFQVAEWAAIRRRIQRIQRGLFVGLSGNYNVTRRARRSYENFHRDKRRSGVDRLAMLESRTGRPRKSGVREFFAALSSLLRRR